MSDTKVYLVVEKTDHKVILKGVYSHKNEAENAMHSVHLYTSNLVCVHEVDYIEYAARDVAEDEILWEKA